MTTLVLGGADPRVLLSHLALYGLGAIVEDAGIEVRLGWTPTADPRPCVVTPDADGTAIEAVLRAHAATQSMPGGWLTNDVEIHGAPRGLMSPRLAALKDDAAWTRLQRARHGVLDQLTGAERLLDLRYAAALGEPAYWSRNNKGDILQDDGASRLEMQARNQGSEIVSTKLRKLAVALAAREPAQVLAGLTGQWVRDEVGRDQQDSRTATGLAPPGPTDNALAWCALWGISQLPTAMRVGTTIARGVAATSGHLRHGRREWFYVPVWRGQWRPARLRSILASTHLRTAAAAGLPPTEGATSDLDVLAARSWLSARAVVGLIRFPIERFGSDNAPERRAMRGEAVSIDTLLTRTVP